MDILVEKEVYLGKYRNIAFEIHNSDIKDCSSCNGWTYYIYIIIDRFPEIKEKLWRKGGLYNKFMEQVYFHHGVTFFERHNYSDGGRKWKRYIQVGCDYMHLWDRDIAYSLEDIKRDVKRTIDSFHVLYDQYKKEKE